MSTKKNRIVAFFLHLLVWLVLFSFPYLLSSGQEQDIIRVFAHSWVPLTLYMTIFYANYFWFSNLLLLKKKIFVFIVINVFLIALCIGLHGEINELFFKEVFFQLKADKNGPPIRLFLYVQIITFLVPLFFSVALKMTERWFKEEAQRKEAANIKLESELQYLRYQLQPHFFFNSLNTIYSLVDVSPEDAKSTIHSLSKLIRYLLYETNTELIALSNEIDFMKKYIELMKLRISEKTKVKYDFPVVDSTVKIAPLLFISLVENAFKHGVSADFESDIYFEIKFVDNCVFFKSENHNYPKVDSDKSGSGIGFQNLEKRLQLLYPDKYSFNKTIKNNTFSTTLSIQL